MPLSCCGTGGMVLYLFKQMLLGWVETHGTSFTGTKPVIGVQERRIVSVHVRC
jgi:hypothetical protein